MQGYHGNMPRSILQGQSAERPLTIPLLALQRSCCDNSEFLGRRVVGDVHMEEDKVPKEVYVVRECLEVPQH